jgi:hypothetical protein
MLMHGGTAFTRTLLLLLCRRVIYHGPVTEVQQHFQSLGFDLPPRMDVPSWLVEITTPSGTLVMTAGIIPAVLVLYVNVCGASADHTAAACERVLTRLQIANCTSCCAAICENSTY